MVADTAYQDNRTRAGRRQGRLGWGGIFVILALLVVLVGAALFCVWVFNARMQRFYRGYIYPHVYTLGIDLGGMQPEEAQTVLARVSNYPGAEALILRDGEQRWSTPWEEAGLVLDAGATAQAAYTVGRTDLPLSESLGVWFEDHAVTPLFGVDLAQTRAVLEAISDEVSVPPVEASLALEQGEVVIVPGEPGRVLDITAMLGQLETLPVEPGEEVIIDLVFREVEPLEPDTTEVQAQAEALLERQITLTAYDVLTEETLRWTLGREAIAGWLHLVPGPEGEPVVDVNLYAIRDTLTAIAGEMGDGRGFRFDDAAQEVLNAFDAGEESVRLFLTHPERTYTVQLGDTLIKIARRFGMPPGLVYEANADIDLDKLSVGQQIVIPSQDVLTPYMPVLGKKIVINIDEQRMYVYENGALIHEWLVSTGMEDSPTDRGTFQILSREQEAYASQWDLLMPYFMAIYRVGGEVYNGIHELPILKNGQRLWEGHLGSKASFGCVILGIPEAETLFNWAEIGVIVVVE